MARRSGAVVSNPWGRRQSPAQQHGCELIVMGTHGRSAIGNLFMGSVAMRVASESPIPVLSVK